MRLLRIHIYPSIRFNGISRRIPNWLQVLRSLWHFRKGQWPTETPKDGVLEGSKWHEMSILFTFIDDVVDDSLEDWLEPCPGLWEIMPDNKNPSYTSPLAYSNLRFENLSLILNRKSHTAIGARKRPPGVESHQNTRNPAPLAAFNMIRMLPEQFFSSGFCDRYTEKNTSHYDTLRLEGAIPLRPK